MIRGRLLILAFALAFATCGHSSPDTLTPCQQTAIAPYGRITLLTASQAYQAMEARCGVPSGR